MPWEESTLWYAKLVGEGEKATLEDKVKIAGGNDTAVSQPTFSQDGQVYFVWDQSGFSLLYRWEIGGKDAPELAMEELKSDITSPGK